MAQTKWTTDLHVGDVYEFTGLTGQTWPGIEVRRLITVIGIGHNGDLDIMLEMYHGDDRTGRVNDRVPLLAALEMIEQGIWREAGK